MATAAYPHPRERLESSWYALIARQLQALTPKFGMEHASRNLYRAYDLICRESLGRCPVVPATRSSTLNHDGAPIQFALTLGRPGVALQFLSEAGYPGQSPVETRQFIERRVRRLSALFQLRGNLDSAEHLIQRVTEVNAHLVDPDRGGTFWMGAGVAAAGQVGLKIYINGRNGSEAEQWARLDTFAAYFGANEKPRDVRQLLAGGMTPLGMAISLRQDEGPAGRIYFLGYGNRVSYYERLLRHFGGEQQVEGFRQFTEVLLREDRAYPTQSVVFSIGFVSGQDRQIDVKTEFCGHCLFPSDTEARDRCLEWLALRKIDPQAYQDLLEVTGGRLSGAKVNTHIYFGQGWKQQQEYTTIYLKPHPACLS
jgi:hypothetical protein